MKALSFFSLFLFFLISCNTQKEPAYLNPDLPVDKRVDDLVSRMTLEEKVSQMTSHAAAIPRLGIPGYHWWNECLHGVARAGVATVFPQAIAMAATWDPALIQREADVISTEARAKHHEAFRKGEHDIYQGLTFWSPNVNLFRDPRWGRGQETYGEDPFLESRIGVAFVKGLQGDDPKYFKVIATPKHFVVHSGPEPLRHGFNAVTSERDFYESYLPAFRATVSEGGAWSVMGAYSAYKGVPCNASTYLLDTVLRRELGFRGYVVSDCGAVNDIMTGHHLASSLAEASAMAVKAGCDLDCGTEYTTLPEAVEQGLLTEKDIDRSVKRLMKARFLLDMFDPPERVAYQKIPITANDTKKNRHLAREVARKSMVLLKNDGLLPLDRTKIRKIAVIGPYADDYDALVGNYHGTPSCPVTFLQGIRNALGERAEILYARGVEPLEKYVTMRPVEPEMLAPSAGSKVHGMDGAYFDNEELKGVPAMVRMDTVIRFYWDIKSPGKGVPADHFSVQWSGFFVAPVTGKVEIGIVSDDRSRVWFYGKKVVDNWQPCEVNKVKSFTADVEKGKYYPLRIEYAEIEGYAGVRLEWRLLEKKNGGAQLLQEAVARAKEADVAVVVAGISPRLEGEEMPVHIEGFSGGDRTSLDMPAPYEQLIEAVHATGTPVVLVLTGGSALAVNWADEHLPAILMAWYPGEEGGNALADILLGQYNPAGRLPVTFYRSVDDLPPFTDYFMKGRTYRFFEGEPLYPFGYGLSYTSFDYEKIALPQHAGIRDTVQVQVIVRNSGSRDGEEVVQLYVHNPADKEGPRLALKGFRRVMVKSGEEKVVTIPLAVQELAVYHPETKRFAPDPGTYRIMAGASSGDIRLKTTLVVK
jgi:beta-glucosidase